MTVYNRLSLSYSTDPTFRPFFVMELMVEVKNNQWYKAQVTTDLFTSFTDFERYYNFPNGSCVKRELLSFLLCT